MTKDIIISVFSLVALWMHPIPSRAQTALPDDTSARCTALEGADFSGTPDALTQVIEAKQVESNGGIGKYCQVTGYVAPSFGFLLRLPSKNWNGKFIELGCGGACGSTTLITMPMCDDSLHRGYACVVSDGGHRSSAVDLKWAHNNPQAMIDYLVLASHVTALAGKAISERYYLQPPRKSYFMGCSAGGIQAMWEAQRFPWDFDGIVAGGPALQITGVWMNLLWANRALTGKSGDVLLKPADLDVLHEAVLGKCDLNDGVKDGLIGDPRSCHFDPSELLCTRDRAHQCLTAPQIEAVSKIYRGPVTSKGEQIALPTALLGSELSWLDAFGGSESNPTGMYKYIGDGFRYFLLQPDPGREWKPETFDFDRDFKRMGLAEGVEPGSNPDLRRFKAAGSKLLVYTGWSDAVEGVLRTVDYYEATERLLGGRATTETFFRLFVIPGMNHCTGGDGAFAVDYLSYIEAWVENGQAPDKLIGAHVRLDDPSDAFRLEFPLDPATVEFTRPVFPYPTAARYMGHGDQRDATNYGRESGTTTVGR